MAGSMYRWKDSSSMPGNDTSSHYSATYSDISVDDRCRNPDIGQRLQTLFREQLYTDVKFVISCGVKPKPTLMAHKAILAVGSPKFKDMFYESGSQSDSNEIQINNVPFDIFKSVVEYLYTDDVIFESDQAVMDILSTAAVFQVQSLVDKCESYIESVELTEDNVCSKFQMAISRSLSSLKYKCVEFLQENTGAVLRSTDFLSVNPSTVKSICKLEKFNLRSEMDLMSAIVRYVENRPDYKMNRRAGIDSYLKHIKLLNSSCEEFNQFVQKYPNVFTSPEAASILMTLANPRNPSPNLPSWCKRGNNRCNYHLLSAPRIKERVTNLNITRQLFIPLMSSKQTKVISISELVSVLEIVCLQGYHRIDGLKLSFDNPVYETSVINQFTIHVSKSPGKFYFEELLSIEQSKEVIHRFSHQLLTKRGDTIYIRAIAKGVTNYRFLQFDERSSFSNDGSFSCRLGSALANNKMFVISAVQYRDGPPPRKTFPVYRNRRRVYCLVDGSVTIFLLQFSYFTCDCCQVLYASLQYVALENNIFKLNEQRSFNYYTV